MWGSGDVTAADHGGATHWTVPARGMEETVVLALAKPPGLPLVSALGDVGGFRHDDLTKVPSKALSGPQFTNTTGIDFAQAKPGFMVRVGLGGAQHGAYSTDGGADWTPFAGTPLDGAGGGTVAVSADGATVVWTPSGQRPFYSTNHGSAWAAASGLPADTAVVADRSAANTFYALTGGTLYASTDGGRSFSARATGLGDGSLKAAPGPPVTCGSPAEATGSRTPPTAERASPGSPVYSRRTASASARPPRAPPTRCSTSAER